MTVAQTALEKAAVDLAAVAAHVLRLLPKVEQSAGPPWINRAFRLQPILTASVWDSPAFKRTVTSIANARALRGVLFAEGRPGPVVGLSGVGSFGTLQPESLAMRWAVCALDEFDLTGRSPNRDDLERHFVATGRDLVAGLRGGVVPVTRLTGIAD